MENEDKTIALVRSSLCHLLIYLFFLSSIAT